MRIDVLWRVVLYDLLLLLVAIPVLAWIGLRYLVLPGRRGHLAERFGAGPRGEGTTVWVHAVSVGEVLAAVPMLGALRERLSPGSRLFLSTVTPTGREAARREFPGADALFYLPFDFPGAVDCALGRVRPSVFVTVETELWPNLLAACHRRGVPVAVVNGRISDRSFGRYRLLRWFFAPFLRLPRAYLMQGPEDARRITFLGAPAERVSVSGNTKYDRLPRPPVLPPAVVAWAKEAPLLVGGSTHAGEEEALLAAARHPRARARGLRLALVPRHPERFNEVARLLERREILHTRYSAVMAGEPCRGEVLLVDAMGVLEGMYALGDIAFVGGSLVPVGGHNLLEPAALAKPVLTGPHTGNFRDIAAALLRSGGARQVPDHDALAAEVAALAEDRVLRATMGEVAGRAAREDAGASVRNAMAVIRILEEAR